MTARAPVAVVAYRRPEHLSRVLDALRGCEGADETDLHVFVDGPRSSKEEPLVEAVAELAGAVAGFRSISVTRQPVNIGLAASVTGAVTGLLELHDRVIILEDDIEVGPTFLSYMNDALALYADDLDVAAVHGYSYPTDAGLPETFFRRGTDCWGWGTWRRAWQVYEADAGLLLQRLEHDGLIEQFDIGGVAPFSRMLRDQERGRIDSWAVRWHASAFLAGMYTLFPARSLARNIGVDGSGQHVGLSSQYDVEVTLDTVAVERIPVEETPAAWQSLHGFYSGAGRPEAKGAQGAVRSTARSLGRRLPMSWRRRLVRALPPGARRYLR